MHKNILLLLLSIILAHIVVEIGLQAAGKFLLFKTGSAEPKSIEGR
jgi:hypothetical protein